MDARGRRRLLLVAYYYPPLGGAGSLRALSFARHLPALGWDVVVVAPREGAYGRDPSLDGEGLEGVSVVRTGTWEPAVLLRRLRRAGGRGGSGGGAGAAGEYVEEVALGPLGGLARRTLRRALYFPDSARGWVSRAAAAARKAHRAAPFDAVLSSSPPVSAHLAARAFARSAGVPWVADWRDPFALQAGPGKGDAERAARLEAGLVEEADGTLAATEGLALALSRGRRLRAPAAVVRNGYEPSDFPAPGPPPRREVPEVVLAGSLYGESQDLTAFLEAAARVRARRPFLLRLLGKPDPRTAAVAGRLGLGDSVRAEGFRTHRETIEAVAGADLLLLPVWSEDTERGRLVCPAKAYEYLASGRPVLALALPGSEAGALLAGRAGVRVHGFGDREGIERSLEEALDGRSGARAGAEDGGEFTRRAQAGRAAEVLAAAAAAGCRR